MRITAGILGGRHIRVPSGPVRPTQDKVRQALFSMLGSKVAGARFLDLYAGSGSVGIEAWSRGASRVVWVELDRRTAGVLCENTSLCGEETRVVVGDAMRVVKKGLENCQFDIIFADPPYQKESGAAKAGDWRFGILRAIEAGGILAPGGLVVLEQAAGGAGELPAGWQLIVQRRYGASELIIARPGPGIGSREGGGNP